MTSLLLGMACWALQPAALALDWYAGQQITLWMPPTMTGGIATTARQVLADDLRNVLDADLQPAADSVRADIVCRLDPTLPREGYGWRVNDHGLTLSAADAHGLAYALMEVSRRLGVSPWEDWADATPTRRTSLHLDPTSHDLVEGPRVAYRGLFINDEDWGLNPWATSLEPEAWVIRQGQIRGAVGPQVTERIFRLMLRLRLNYYWPPMHECTQPFFLTPGNREVAARYGIYVGGSHCEPMASSAAAEWGLRGVGDYNYVTNPEGVRRFWQERLDSVCDQEIVYTLGMRGVHDGAMQGVSTREERRQALQQVIDEQRQMLASTLGREPEGIPQVFVPYKEVLDVYLDGLNVPDDVTLMWTDDNYGYVRHYPTPAERQRRGGHGLYYHVSYWGRPHDYCWLSTLSPYLMEHQLTEAYRRGIRQMWMLNVGDIKPAEVQLQVYSDLAWHGVTDDWTQGNRTHGLLRQMLATIFDTQPADDVEAMAACLEESYRLAWDRKPEHLAGTRVEERDRAYWNQIRAIDYWTADDVRERLTAYGKLARRVEDLARCIPSGRQDAYLQLVKYPIQAAAQMNVKYLCPDRTLQAQDSIRSLTLTYNHGLHNDGRWARILTDAPRSLRVFAEVRPEDLPAYPDSTGWQPLLTSATDGEATPLTGLGTKGWMLDVPRGKACAWPLPARGSWTTADSVRVSIHLLPTLPTDDGRLTFGIAVDDGEATAVSYETYDRSEEWKRNVLRNNAVREVTLTVDHTKRHHTIRLEALTDNVVLDQIYVR